MPEVHWRCEHPITGDVKMAAQPDHRYKLEMDGYVCEIYEDLAPVDLDEEGHD